MLLMACNCIKEVQDSLKNKLSKDKEYEDKDLKVNITNVCWLFDGGERLYSEVEVSYPWVTKTGKDRIKKSKVNVNYSYCPFCGKKLKE
jgi:NMD protein affecting ribosome stability and mRNA decay